MEPVVVCEGLCKHFHAAATLVGLLRGRLRGRRIDALSDVHLQVGAGECLGVLGPNGAGKSTLLKLVAGLLLPDAGRLDVLGQAVASTDASYRHRVTYLCGDERSFAWRLSGRDNLAFFAALHGLRGRAARRRCEEVLRSVGLSDQADRTVREYSSGMRQRLGLARGLLGDPEVLLVDEPTRGIDPRGAAEVRGLLRERLLGGKRRAVLLATHDLAETQQLCDRVVVIEDGRIRAAGTAAEAAELLDL